MTASSINIGPADYAVLIGTLTLSSLFGIYFGYRDRRKTTSNNYYFGGKTMNPLIVALSLAVTNKSAITMIGIPSETYIIGTSILWICIIPVFTSLLNAHFFTPSIHRLQLSSINEYLELRFSKVVRQVMSAAQFISTVLYMATAIYIPSMALSVVTPLSITWSIVLTTVICTFYTTLGGYKAVIWTDTLQAIIMLIGSLAVVTKTLMVVGGFAEVSAALDRGQRNTFFDEDFDITSRKSPLYISVGRFFLKICYLAFTPSVVQRLVSCKTIRKAQCSLIFEILPEFFISTLAVVSGFAMYTYFEGCDPVESGKLGRLDQGISYIALEVFQSMPGMTGLFIAAIYSATLSTVSSAINAYAIVMVEDFIRPSWPVLEREDKKITVVKITSFIFGAVFMLISFVVASVKFNIVKITIGIINAFSSPVYGTFLCGFLFPWINSAGVIVGAVFSYVVLVWMFLGSMFLLKVPPRVNLPPTFTNMCPSSVTNMSFINNITTSQYLATSANLDTTGFSFDQFIYSINFHCYILIGIGLTISVGLLVSYLTGFSSPSDLNPKLFIPMFDNRFLPTKVRKFFRFGVPELVEPGMLGDSEMQKMSDCYEFSGN